MKSLVLALSAFSLLAASGPSLASPACRNKAGKFIKCPPKHLAVKMCRDSRGHFMKCK
jgi:hypothetical protein